MDVDVVVVGAGVVGTMTARELAERGRHTLVLEQHELGTKRASSHGLNRIVRVTDYHPDYVRLNRLARFAALIPTDPPETCLYTNTPDHDYILDRVGAVVIGSPCSGHGFKASPMIGAILADLATGATPALPLDRYQASRPALHP
jgi:sarcosine oxidase